MVDCTDRLAAICNEVRLSKTSDALVLSDTLYNDEREDSKIPVTISGALNCSYYMRKLQAFCRVANDMTDPCDILRFYFAYMNNVREVLCLPTSNATSSSLYAKLSQRRKKWSFVVQFSTEYWLNNAKVVFALPDDYFRTTSETCNSGLSFSYIYVLLAYLIETHVYDDLFKAWPAYVSVAAILTGDRYARQPFYLTKQDFD